MKYLVIAFTAASLQLFATNWLKPQCRPTEESVMSAVYGLIDARALKAIVDAQVTCTILDARGLKGDDGRRIPGAKLAHYQNSLAEFEKLIPSKETLVIVYCGAYECTLSGKLADRLIQLGYKNVLEYPGGLKEWSRVAGYPVDQGW
jgi:rhodanese-related sulfurtransferase